MPDTVITRINSLNRDQPEQFIFTNRRGRPIGDVKILWVDPSDVNYTEILGVDASDIDINNIKIPGVDVDIQEPQVIEIVDPEIPPTEPTSIEPAPVHQVATKVYLIPYIQQVDPELCRSSRVTTQTENYTPSMSGSK